MPSQRITVTAPRIFVVCTALASLTGCHALHIPSYRVDSARMPSGSTAEAGFGGEYLTSSGEVYCEGGMGSCQVSGLDAEQCPPSILPPLPGWLSGWMAKEELPEPPAYPRFQPLPTRPMFSPRPPQNDWSAALSNLPPEAGIHTWGTAPAPYGHWPAAGEQPQANGPVSNSPRGAMPSNVLPGYEIRRTTP